MILWVIKGGEKSLRAELARMAPTGSSPQHRRATSATRSPPAEPLRKQQGDLEPGHSMASGGG